MCLGVPVEIIELSAEGGSLPDPASPARLSAKPRAGGRQAGASGGKANKMAVVSLGGVKREVSIQLLGDVKVGDFVLLHAGFAIQKIDKVQAQETLELLREMANLVEER